MIWCSAGFEFPCDTLHQLMEAADANKDGKSNPQFVFPTIRCWFLSLAGSLSYTEFVPAIFGLLEAASCVDRQDGLGKCWLSWIMHDSSAFHRRTKIAITSHATLARDGWGDTSVVVCSRDLQLTHRSSGLKLPSCCVCRIAHPCHMPCQSYQLLYAHSVPSQLTKVWHLLLNLNWPSSWQIWTFGIYI